MPDTAPMPDDASPVWSRAGALGLAAIIAASAVVRGAALFNALWLDEVWTLRNVAGLASAGGVFTQFLNDNNHPLVSLWARLVMPTPHEWLLRLPSWLAGLAAVALAAEIARLQFRRLRPAAPVAGAEAAGLLTAALFASAYLLTAYFSEARGYGPVVAFALLALLALLRDPEGVTWRWTLTYWLACALGLLAHATMVQVMAGACAWSAVHALHAPDRGRAWRALARWHGAPIAGAALYYFAFLRHLSIGGGPVTPRLTVLGEAASHTFGLPASAAVLLLVLLGLGAGLVWMSRRSRGLAALSGVMIFVAPLATITLSRFTLLFPRYLIVAGVGALLVAGFFLALLWGRSRLGAGAVLALLVAGHARPTVQLLRDGRGDFPAVLRHLAAHTPAPEISVCSDHDNRTVPLLQFYAPSTLPGGAIRYVRGDSPRRHGARWLLVAQVDDRQLGHEVRDDAGNTFTLEARFPRAPLSGSEWLVYRDRTFPAP